MQLQGPEVREPDECGDSVRDRVTLGLAWVDISTGQFRCQAIERKALPAALARLDPTEILLPDRLLLQSDLYELFQEWKSALSPLPNARFDSENARLRLQNFQTNSSGACPKTLRKKMDTSVRTTSCPMKRAFSTSSRSC